MADMFVWPARERAQRLGTTLDLRSPHMDEKHGAKHTGVIQPGSHRRLLEAESLPDGRTCCADRGVRPFIWVASAKR
jgi:hypothetical protein